MQNVGIGTNALKSIEKGSYNFVIGKNSGTSIKNGNCNFIFGDNIPGEDTDNQFIFREDMPILTSEQAKGFLDNFLEIYDKLCESYPKNNAFTLDQLKIMKEKMIALLKFREKFGLQPNFHLQFSHT
jgi:hypothetical protein